MKQEIINKAVELRKLIKDYGNDYRLLDDIIITNKELIKLILK